jgi:hypothetical protein
MVNPSVKCETFNPGISPIDLPANFLSSRLASVFGKVPFGNIKDNHINGDPISGTLGVGRTTSYDCGFKMPTFEAHSHDNFLRLLDEQYNPPL